MYHYEMKRCNHENAIIFPGITLKFKNIMATEITEKKTETPINSAFENVKSLFKKIFGKTVENEAKPQSTGIGSTIIKKSSDQPIKWPLPVKK
jgi:hypothetical protein